MTRLVHLAGAGVALGLFAVAAPAQAQSWDGIYVGGLAGYATGDLDGTLHDDAAEIVGETHRSISNDGWLAGAYVGYQRQVGSFVVGIEADIAGGNVDGSTSASIGDTVTARVETELDLLATARARLGYLVSPALLVYGTGGVAWADMDVNGGAWLHCDDETITLAKGRGGETHIGWVAGLGAEWQISQIRLRAEWLHVDLGRETYGLRGTILPGTDHAQSFSLPGAAKADLSFDVFRVGMTFPLGQ